jgi:hypothetical protein
MLSKQGGGHRNKWSRDDDEKEDAPLKGVRAPGEDAACRERPAKPILPEGKYDVVKERDPLGRCDITHCIFRNSGARR